MLGERVSELLVKSFEDIFDVTFTARLEEELDEIEEGKLPWREAVKEFWEKFVVDLDRADDEMLSYKAGIPTGRSARSAARANCSSASAAMAFSWAARAIRNATSSRTFRRSFPRRPDGRTARSNTATIAARRWSSSAAASASSWRARAIRTARPRAAWSKARAWRGSPTSRWTKSAPIAARNW